MYFWAFAVAAAETEDGPYSRRRDRCQARLATIKSTWLTRLEIQYSNLSSSVLGQNSHRNSIHLSFLIKQTNAFLAKITKRKLVSTSLNQISHGNMQNQEEADEAMNQSNEQDVDSENAARQQSPSKRQLVQRPTSFSPPFPVQAVQANPATGTSTPAPLTNHEIYELLIQKQQQQVGGASQALQTPIIGGSFKQLGKRQPFQKTLERQGSVIVGTPGFRERYGKFKSHEK